MRILTGDSRIVTMLAAVGLCAESLVVHDIAPFRAEHPFKLPKAQEPKRTGKGRNKGGRKRW